MVSETLKAATKDSLKKAVGHLKYSYDKVQKNNLLKKSEWTEEQLEILESFSSRFARASDLFISKYLRLLALETDPAYRGTLIDLLNLAEKMNWISSAKQWSRIRELRNVAAHEYTEEDLRALYQEIFRLSDLVLSVSKLL